MIIVDYLFVSIILTIVCINIIITIGYYLIIRCCLRGFIFIFGFEHLVLSNYLLLVDVIWLLWSVFGDEWILVYTWVLFSQ